MLRSFICLTLTLFLMDYAAAQPTSNEAANQIDRRLQENFPARKIRSLFFWMTSPGNAKNCLMVY